MPRKPPNPKPVQRSGDGPGRWNYESGSSPNTRTVPIVRRPRPTAS
ncbi:hypothetical protein ACFQ8C_05435 [Streptomyces sp. NPDC056503]